MLRGILAIVVGLFVIDVLALGGDLLIRQLAPAAVQPAGGVDRTPILVVMLLYRAVFSAVGGHVAASIAHRNEAAHALVLGALQALLTLIAAVTLDDSPVWFRGPAVLLALPSVWLGGYLRARQRRPHPAETEAAVVA